VERARECDRRSVQRVAGFHETAFRALVADDGIGRARRSAGPALDARADSERWEVAGEDDRVSRTHIDAAPTAGPVVSAVQASGAVDRDGSPAGELLEHDPELYTLSSLTRVS
jgi:hypothetical protein